MRLSLWVAVVFPLCLGGCYGAKMMRQPITVEETARDLEAVRQQQAALEKRLGDLEKRSQEQAELLRGLKADTGSRWDDLDNRLLAIDSKLKDALGSRGGYASTTQNWNATPSIRSSPAETDTDRTSDSGADTSAARGSRGPGMSQQNPPASSGSSGSSGDAANPADQDAENKRVYDQAYLDQSRGNYSLAILGFREFLRRAPSSELADNAQYWIGESYYAQRDFSTAVQEFLKVQQDYPNGDKVPAALLKIGYSYLQLDDRPSARRYLNQVLEQFPNSDEAGLAKNKLRSAG